jgi:hypothetical protein
MIEGLPGFARDGNKIEVRINFPHRAPHPPAECMPADHKYTVP